MISMGRLRNIAAYGIPISLLALVSACGGGGSSAGSASSSGTPIATTSGLVPTAGTVGAVLYPSAATLRPMIDGASWTFHSYDNTGSGETGFTRTQKVAATGAFTETDSDAPNDPTTVSVDANSGQVNISASLNTGLPIANLPINGPELKSPVKTNDQIVLLDRHIADIGIDIDKDGKDDAMDVAMYRLVVGNETLTLPNRSESLTALRVDTTAAIRVIPSGGGVATLTTQVQRTWYAPGIGVVKQVLQGATPSAPFVREDFLLGFDSTTSRWGVVTRGVQMLNDGSNNLVPRALAALPLANGVLMVGGDSVFQLDSLGKLVAKHSLAEYGLSTSSSPNWMLTSSGPRVIGKASSGNTSRTAVGLYALNADGSPGSQYLGDVDVFSLSPSGAFDVGGSLVGAPTSEYLWGVMTRQVVSAGNSTNTVVVRFFNSDGHAVSDEIALPTVVQATNLRSQVTANGLMLSWTDVTPTLSSPANAQAFVTNSGLVAWQTQIPLPGGSVGTMQPVVSDGGAFWLLWNSTPNSTSGATPHAISVDADFGQLIGVTLGANFFANTKLSQITSPALLSHWPDQIVKRGNDMVVSGTAFGQAFSGDSTKTAYVELADYFMGSGNPAYFMTLVSDTVIPGVTFLPVPPIVFNGHTLLLTDDGQYLRATTIWK